MSMRMTIVNNTMRLTRPLRAVAARPASTRPTPRHSQSATALQPNLDLPGFDGTAPAPEDLWRRFIRERFAPVWQAIRGMMLVPCDAKSPGAGFDYVIVTELSAILSAMSEVHNHCVAKKPADRDGASFIAFVGSEEYFPAGSCWHKTNGDQGATKGNRGDAGDLYSFIRCKHAHTLGMVKKEGEEDIVIHRDRVTYAELLRVETSDDRPENVLPILRRTNSGTSPHRWVLSINSLYWSTYRAVRRLDGDMVASDAARGKFAERWTLSDHDQAAGAAATNESARQVVAPNELVSEHNKGVWERMSAEGENRSALPPELERAQCVSEFRVLPLAVSVELPTTWWGELRGKDVLCVASGGGFQGPILAAAGANVSVLDISVRQLERDRAMAEKHGLSDRLTTIPADAATEWPVEASGVDLVVIPFATGLFADVHHLWKEAYRVLRSGGRLVAGMTNPAAFLFDQDAAQHGFPLAVHRLPYSDLDRPDLAQLRALTQQRRPLCFSHSLEALVGGQVSVGFRLSHLGEPSQPGAPQDRLMMATEFVTVATKP